MPNVLTKGYSHLDGSLQWYGKVCENNIDDVDGGDNNDDDDSDDFEDVDEAGDDDHDDHDRNFVNNKQ